MLHDILMDSLDERIVRYRLHEDRAVVVFGGCRYVHLKRELVSFHHKPVVYVRDGFEPCEARIVNVVRLVIQNHKLVNVAYDIADIHLRLVRFANRLATEKIVRRVRILKAGRFRGSLIDSVNVGEEDVACFTHRANVVLYVERHLEIVPPILSFVSIVGEHGILEEYFETAEIREKPIKHDDVRRDDEEVPSELRTFLEEFVEVRPCKDE